jgi:hypothetical protein
LRYSISVGQNLVIKCWMSVNTCHNWIFWPWIMECWWIIVFIRSLRTSDQAWFGKNEFILCRTRQQKTQLSQVQWRFHKAIVWTKCVSDADKYVHCFLYSSWLRNNIICASRIMYHVELYQGPHESMLLEFNNGGLVIMLKIFSLFYLQTSPFGPKFVLSMIVSSMPIITGCVICLCNTFWHV